MIRDAISSYDFHFHSEINNTMKNTIYLTVLMLMFCCLSCGSPDDSNVEQPQELITHVRVTLIDSLNQQDSVVAKFSDPDGPSGSQQPVISGVTIKAGHIYIGRIQLYEVHTDLADSLVEITDEIRELNTEHQFFYTVEGQVPNAAVVEITDKDANNLPLGLTFVLRASSPANNTLNVVLSHFSEVGQKNGTDRSGDSDIDIDFPLTIE
jgi:hypothetical protein